ncbi:MAG: replicative DNA helicase [Clostridia bacterium]|nr:replicative DNA helicase [Clostridia bacterium]MBR4012898.1 replicative DNA helicase [Clostridia bacterium]
MNDELLKKLPFSLVTEQSLLGSIIIAPETLDDVVQLISPSDFYISEHAEIFMALKELFLNSKDIDFVTLVDALVTKGVYTEAAATDYITQLVHKGNNALNVKDYAKIIKDKSLLRKLIDVCDEVSEKAYSEEGEAARLVDYAESLVFDIAQGRDTKNFRHISDVINDVYKNLHAMATEGEAAQGTKTGFSGVDTVLAGMGNSDLILVGARPGMGKTSFALNIATNVAVQSKKTVCIFSLEMSAEQLVSRIISSEAMIDSVSLRTGKLDSKQWSEIAKATTRLAGCNILIDDTTGMTVTGMKGKLRRVKDLGLVVVDYLGLMQSDRKIDNRVNEVAEISRNLKIMAKELNVPVICCAQLSRGPESRTDKRPMLSDLRDSGAIEQDADVVIFLYKDDYYDKKDGSGDEGCIAEVIIAKNRHGSTNTVKMGWIGRYTKFRTIAENVGEAP